MKNIELKPTNKFTIITVVNWDQYQQNETQVKLKRNSSETQVKTNKNDKNEKNEENDNKIYSKFLNGFNKIVGSKHRETEATKRQFKARLKNYSLKDMLVAVKNASGNEYLMGKNDSNKRYLTPEYILRENKLDNWLNSSSEKGNSKWI